LSLVSSSSVGFGVGLTWRLLHQLVTTTRLSAYCTGKLQHTNKTSHPHSEPQLLSAVRRDDTRRLLSNIMDHNRNDASVHCCADCGEEGGVSLKTCKSCMLVKYCNANCQRNHWPTHKQECKRRAAELRDEALFKDPPDKEDCPICFLPMPTKIISCVSLPPANITSVPIHDCAEAKQI